MKISTMTLAAAIAKEITKAEKRGDTKVMISHRLSGLVSGLKLAGAITEDEALEMLIEIKNEFNI